MITDTGSGARRGQRTREGFLPHEEVDAVYSSCGTTACIFLVQT